jgi:iron-sulfur cluster repair protein YtfE (RIC family)
MTQTLAEALEREHVDIDAGIEQFTAGVAAGEPVERPMLAAIEALRRHIYLEEAILFPPLRAAGMFGPVMVMLHEHGRMWRTLDDLEPLVRQGGTDARVAGLCADLVSQLQAHNPKEEQILYPQADHVLNDPANRELREFLASGSMPDGWVCESA